MNSYYPVSILSKYFRLNENMFTVYGVSGTYLGGRWGDDHLSLCSGGKNSASAYHSMDITFLLHREIEEALSHVILSGKGSDIYEVVLNPCAAIFLVGVNSITRHDLAHAGVSRKQIVMWTPTYEVRKVMKNHHKKWEKKEFRTVIEPGRSLHPWFAIRDEKGAILFESKK